MSEGQEIQASREEVEEFVGKLRGFYGGLQSSAERANAGVDTSGCAGWRHGWVRQVLAILRRGRSGLERLDRLDRGAG